MVRNNTIALLLLILISSGGASAQSGEQDSVLQFVKYSFGLSEVMVHDVVNPPAAGRFYAYSFLAAYQVISAQDSTLPDLQKLFRYPLEAVRPPLPKNLSTSFASIYAMLEVGRLIMPSGYMLEEKQLKLVDTFKRYGVSSRILKSSIEYAKLIAGQVMSYAAKDGYSRLSTLARYQPERKEGFWYPTPPEYMAAVEPHWNTIRTFLLDSSGQYGPSKPTEFSKDKNSDFFPLMNEVYQIGRDLTGEQKDIAAFWDCNPFAVTYSGHMAIGLKKISPGGHWIGITGITVRQQKASFRKSVFTHALVALTLHDAFVSCWAEKYRSNRIRPEAAINKYIDRGWRPFLQTPPFPEYTSGHSVISTASAEILTFLFGNDFQFTDTSEEYFGLQPRTFGSFRSAANEAAISRLYGGIHFRDAIESGQLQGKAIADHIIQKIKNLTPASWQVQP